MSVKCGKPSCGKPITGGFLCKGCMKTLEVAIVNVAAYYDDLETVRTKQTRYGIPTSTATSSSAVPLPIDARFSQSRKTEGGELQEGVGTKAQHLARKAVSHWTLRLLADEPSTHAPRADTVRSAAHVLQTNVKAIARHHWAAEALSDFLHCERALQRVVDRPPDYWYAGICGTVVAPEREHNAASCACACHAASLEPIDANHYLVGPLECDIPGGCGTDQPTIEAEVCTRVLYAEPGNPFVRCRDCGTTHSTKERREKLLGEARDHELTIRLIARIVLALGDVDSSEAKLENRISKWVERGKLKSHSKRVVNGVPRPLYRVGDVIDLLVDDTRNTTSRMSS